MESAVITRNHSNLARNICIAVTLTVTIVMSVSIGMPEWYTTESKTSYNNTSEGYPSKHPETYPSKQPGAHASKHPEEYPSKQPEAYPSKQPGAHASKHPEEYPSKQPEAYPSKQPGAHASKHPEEYPSKQPETHPNQQPEAYPSKQPDGFYNDTTAIYMYNHTLDIHTGAGLFKTCWKVMHLTACKTYKGDMLEDWIQVSQAFGIISVLFIAGAGICFGLLLWTWNGSWLFGAVFANVLSLICFTICTAVFMSKFTVFDGQMTPVQIGSAFYGAVAAMALCLVDLVAMFMYKRTAGITTRDMWPLNCERISTYDAVEV